MSHLIKIYTVFSLVFEFYIWYSLDLNFFEKFTEENFVVCFSVVKELINRKISCEAKLIKILSAHCKD